MNAKEVIKDTEIKMKKTLEATQREFSVVRTGRASTALVETLKVDYYGVATALRQVASITRDMVKIEKKDGTETVLSLK